MLRGSRADAASGQSAISVAALRQSERPFLSVHDAPFVDERVDRSLTAHSTASLSISAADLKPHQSAIISACARSPVPFEGKGVRTFVPNDDGSEGLTTGKLGEIVIPAMPCAGREPWLLSAE